MLLNSKERINSLLNVTPVFAAKYIYTCNFFTESWRKNFFSRQATVLDTGLEMLENGTLWQGKNGVQKDSGMGRHTTGGFPGEYHQLRL